MPTTTNPTPDPPARDRGRLVLAMLIAAAFVITVVAALGVAAWGSSEARTTIDGLLPVLLPAELTALGAATGYYFAAERR